MCLALIELVFCVLFYMDAVIVENRLRSIVTNIVV